ncbi:MAG: galactokinase family protein [Planctomycetota bacterium]
MSPARPSEESRAFAARLREDPETAALIADDRPLVVARAPGRLDLMGGIADYSGSLVLQMPLAEATLVAAQERDDDLVEVRSLGPTPDDRARRVRAPVGKLRELAAADPARARACLTADPRSQWAAYVLGSLLVLARERGLRLEQGLTLIAASSVPEGKGVSSSAALEIATLRALDALFDLDVPGEELARLGQRAENEIVGAPCGIMDQMASALGRERELLALTCQPARIEGYRSLPDSLAVWGDRLRRPARRHRSELRRRARGRLHGLSHASPISPASPRALSARARRDRRPALGRLPRARRTRDLRDRVPGAAARAPARRGLPRPARRHHGRRDPRRSDRDYAVLLPTLHPIAEHERVTRFASLIAAAADDAAMREMGELMYASHASYSACGLGSDATDRLVADDPRGRPRAGPLRRQDHRRRKRRHRRRSRPPRRRHRGPCHRAALRRGQPRRRPGLLRSSPGACAVPPLRVDLTPRR